MLSFSNRGEASLTLSVNRINLSNRLRLRTLWSYGCFYSNVPYLMDIWEVL